MDDFLRNIFLFNKDAPLIFTRFYFWAFFAVVLALYSIVYKKEKPRNAYLFLVSLFFYYKTSGIFFLLLIFSTIVDFFIGKAIYKSDVKLRRKLLVALSVTVNLSVLVYYKYSGFFTESINYLFGMQLEPVDLLAKWTNQFAGTHFTIDKIILPVGISFFTFQTISYSIDIYRKKLKPVNSIIDFGFYVSFFPQLVAGPIVRAAEFIPQLYKKYSITKAEFGIAIFMILNGLLKKLVVADYIAVNFVDRVFSNPTTYGGFENLMALYGYSLQVYADFSGYTDVAIGVALLMGFRLPVNFNSPYKALHTGEFWKRWHISLSTWLKDYLYIPLGGNRRGKVRTNFNLMLTMLLGGLWHGASWQFVIWGGLNGIGLVVYKYWRQISPFKDSKTWAVRFYAIFLTFNFITVTRIWFRAETMQAANSIMHQITTAFKFSQIGEVIIAYKNIFGVMLVAMIIHWLPVKVKNVYKNIFINSPQWAKATVVVLAVLLIWQARTADLQPFIYFQF
ncbi:MAG: MBOAT family protein [Bacteroidales bacterium]|nr:MBOAT family protein [Bacteroidales bacterium]